MKFNWCNPKLRVASSLSTGRGQFAKADISKDELLVVFGGHVMTMEEFNLLPRDVQDIPYQVSDIPCLLFGPMTREEMSDGDFFNHSCNPNAGFSSPMHLVAMKTIMAGEQVTFDYAMCMTADFGNMECKCGDKDCRGFISGDDYKRRCLQLRYKGYFQPYIEEMLTRFAHE